MVQLCLMRVAFWQSLLEARELRQALSGTSKVIEAVGKTSEEVTHWELLPSGFVCFASALSEMGQHRMAMRQPAGGTLD